MLCCVLFAVGVRVTIIRFYLCPYGLFQEMCVVYSGMQVQFAEADGRSYVSRGLAGAAVWLLGAFNALYLWGYVLGFSGVGLFSVCVDGDVAVFGFVWSHGWGGSPSL